MVKNRVLGRHGENIALNYFSGLGYKVLERNYKCRIGEVDIIAQKDSSLIFIEVKTRTSLSYGHPVESVSEHKIKKIKDVAGFFMANNNNLYPNFDVRFDVVSIIINRGSGFKLEHIENAF